MPMDLPVRLPESVRRARELAHLSHLLIFALIIVIVALICRVRELERRLPRPERELHALGEDMIPAVYYPAPRVLRQTKWWI